MFARKTSLFRGRKTLTGIPITKIDFTTFLTFDESLASLLGFSDENIFKFLTELCKIRKTNRNGIKEKGRNQNASLLLDIGADKMLSLLRSVSFPFFLDD